MVLAVANRHPVTIRVDPFDAHGLTVAVPLYMLIFALIALGVVIGGLAGWLGRKDARRAARADRRELKQLRKTAAPAQPTVLALAPPPKKAGRRRLGA
nr:lipopolysaccharide assembly protein LapA domain-containing protein [Acuticoccus mangrovi]